MSLQTPTPFVTCKTDAAWNKSSNKAGLAWVFIEITDAKKNQGSMTQDFVTSPLIAEALALRSGLVSAADMNLTQIHIFSDNSTLIRAINNDMQIKEIYEIITDIQQIASAFVDISFSHLSRNFNSETYTLAKNAIATLVVSDPLMRGTWTWGFSSYNINWCTKKN